MGIELRSDTRARFDRTVMFACDANYARYALFAAAQIARLTPGRDFDICLCCSDALLEVPSGLGDLGIRSCQVTTDGVFSGLRLDSRRSEAVYLRLALPEALGGDYRRMLYMDSDVYVQGGDFSRLMDLDIGGHCLAAVRDNRQWRSPGRRMTVFEKMGVPAARYFNSGVVMFDAVQFRKAGILERCVDLGRRQGHAFPGHDQELLNGTLQGEWAELNPTWNWQYTWASMLFEAMEGANVVHFIGAKKPWKHTGGALPRRFRRDYMAFLGAHFDQQMLESAEGVPPHHNRRYMRRTLVKHLFSMGRFYDYLDRFEHDFTVFP